METNLKVPKSINQLNVLLIGNNPMEMGNILDKLNKVRSQRIITEIAFDVKSILERLAHFHPNYILIDDNIGSAELKTTVNTLNHNRKTKAIPITVLKNSNYKESGTSSDILDYVLKQDFSGDALINAVKNSLKFRRTQLFLYRTYQKRKGQLLRLVKR